MRPCQPICRAGLMYAASAALLLNTPALAQADLKKSASSSDLSENQTMSGSNYTSLLKPLDIYAPPVGAKKLISLTDLYSLVQSRGVALKVSRETFNAARQSVKTESDKKIPVVSFDMGHDQKWTKSLSDSDFTDDVSDRKKVSGNRSVSSNAGLSLTGAPVQGLSYKVQFPQLAHSQQFPEQSVGNPPRRDSAAFSSSVSLSLLRDNPIFSESLSQKKSNLTLASARESLRADTLRKLAEAESAFYGLVQKYLQLSVQERSLKLAKALESDVKEKIAAGESSALEATRSELQTAQAETDFMSSQIDYEAAVGEFRNSLAFDEKEGQGLFPDPKSLDVDIEKFKVPQDAISFIERENSEIAIFRIAKQIAETDLEIARKSTLPTLALSMNYGNAVPGEGWGKTAAEALKPNDRTFGISLAYSQVIFNDTSRNALQQALVAKQKSEFASEETLRRVLKEFNALVKKLDIGSRRYRIAKISREIAEKKLNSEYEKFKAGESSVRNVIDSQTEVNGARISEIGARVEMLTGYSQLRTLQGKLPDGVSFNVSK